MKRLLLLALLCVLLTGVEAQEQATDVPAQKTQLLPATRIGRQYYLGDQVLTKEEFSHYLLANHCNIAYAQLQKGQKIAQGGWFCFITGTGLDIAGLVCAWKTGKSQFLYMTYAGCALELISIPLLCVGYTKAHRSVDVYNTRYTRQSASVNCTIGASPAGMGVKLTF